MLIESCFVWLLQWTRFEDNLLHFFDGLPSKFNPFKKLSQPAIACNLGLLTNRKKVYRKASTELNYLTGLEFILYAGLGLGKYSNYLIGFGLTLSVYDIMYLDLRNTEHYDYLAGLGLILLNTVLKLINQPSMSLQKYKDFLKFTVGTDVVSKLCQHWKSDAGFCFILNAGSTLFQRWSTTLKQRWSDVETTLIRRWKNVDPTLKCWVDRYYR